MVVDNTYLFSTYPFDQKFFDSVYDLLNGCKGESFAQKNRRKGVMCLL